MRVLVTGAAGYLGCAVVENLQSDYELRAFDCVETGLSGGVVGDIADFATVQRAMEGVDLVANLALLTGRMADPAPMFDVNVRGTYNVVRAAREAGVRRIVHMSSGAVITGYPNDMPIHADLPHKCEGIYPTVKCLQEVICRLEAEAHGLTIVCLRPWGIVDGRTRTGKGDRPLTPGGYYFGLICRHDVAAAVRLALENPGLEGFQVFHLMATPEGCARFDMERTRSLLGWEAACDFAYLREQSA